MVARVRKPVCQGACPAISVTLLRESRVEDACDMKLRLRQTSWSMALLLTGTLGRDTSPLAIACRFRVRPLCFASRYALLFGYARCFGSRPSFRIRPHDAFQSRPVLRYYLVAVEEFSDRNESCSAGNGLP